MCSPLMSRRSWRPPAGRWWRSSRDRRWTLLRGVARHFQPVRAPLGHAERSGSASGSSRPSAGRPARASRCPRRHDRERFAHHGGVDAVGDVAPRPASCRRRRPGSCPRRRARRTTVATVASDVSGPRTISARRITGAGEAQCHPMTWSGRWVTAAIAAIGKPDEFDAKIVRAGASWSTSCQNRSFRSSRSGMASMTRSTSSAS